MAWSGAGNIILMLVSIVSVAILARLLTVADYGIFAAAMIFIGIVRSGWVLGGFPTAVIQQQDMTSLHIRNGFTGMMLVHIAAAALIWAGSGAIASFFDMPELKDVLKALCLIVLFSPVLAMSRALLQRRKRFRLLALTEVVASVFANTAVAIALAWAGFGVWALVISNITWTLTLTLITFSVARFSLVPAITSHMRDLLKVSMGLSVVGTLTVFSSQAARFVIGRALGADALGIFSRANRVLEFPKKLMGSSQVLFPVMVDMNDDKARMARGYLRSMALCSLAAAPLMVLICHGAEGLILLLLGQRWEAAIDPVAILSLTLVFGLGTRVAIVVFTALGRMRELMLRQALLAVLIVAGSIIGSYWGIEGVCVAVLIANFASYALSIHLSNKLLDVEWLVFVKANTPAVLLAMSVLVVLVLGETLIWYDVQPILQFPIETAVTGVVIYGACLVKPVWFLGPDGIWLLNEIRQHVPPRLRILIPCKRP